MNPREGNIEIWEGLFSGWQQRYYILTGKTFMLFSNLGGKLKGQAHLSISNIIADKTDQRKFEMETGFATIQLRASSNKEAISLKMSFLNAKKQLKNEKKDESSPTDSKEVKDIFKDFKEKELEKVNELIAEIWNTQSLLEEELSLLEGRIKKVKDSEPIYESLTATLKLSIQLKRDSTNCYKKMEEVFQKIQGMALTMERRTTMKLSNQRISMKSYQFSPSNTSENGYGIQRQSKVTKQDLALFSNPASRLSKNLMNIGEIDEKGSFAEVASFLNDNENTLFESFDGLEDVVYQEDFKEKSEMKKANTVPMNKGYLDFQTAAQTEERRSTTSRSLSQVQKSKDQFPGSEGIFNNIRLKNPQKFIFLTTNPIYQSLDLKDDLTRKTLPVSKIQYQKINPWLPLREYKGKEFDDFNVPIYLTEPLSILQRICEQFEYCHLLEEASSIGDSYKQLAYVMAFAISSRCHLANRCKKPFSPLVGETYEFESKDRKWRFLAEHISNNPQKSVFTCIGESFKCWGTVRYKMSFKGKSLDISFLDPVYISFKDQYYEITYNNSIISVSNIALGSPKVELTGQMFFSTNNTEARGLINLGADRENVKRVEGLIENYARNRKYYEIEGEWNEELYIIEIKSGEKTLIWKRNPVLLNAESLYNFSEFTLQLNHLNKKLLEALPITDSRFRPDIIAMEYGNPKLSVEESKRILKKNLDWFTKYNESSDNLKDDKEIEYIPMWFDLQTDNLLDRDVYIYNEKYWKQRDRQEFTNLVDIF